MGEASRALLEEEIEYEIKNLTSIETGSPEFTAAIENLTKLYKLKIEEDKNSMEQKEKEQLRKSDKEFKAAQLKESVMDRYFRLGMAGAELILPLIFYGIWMRRGFRFEETGSFTSSTFRGLFSRFRPTKK